MATSIILAALSKKLAANVYMLLHPKKIMHHLRMTASERSRESPWGSIFLHGGAHPGDTTCLG
ncbi:hypothetical protein PF003_g10503 [Phytophthora fragariae]|nr:hypothetical protein PF003_g10503 [Phytophthora fragariae]